MIEETTMPPVLLRLRRAAPFALLAIASLLASSASGAMGMGISEYSCGTVASPGQFGPFDYRTVSSEIRHRVEDYHFTPQVEQGISGQSGYLGGDLDYTLRAFPNNPRALLAISRASSRHHTERVAGAKYPTECYFERAIRFQPDDPMVHVIYAIYLMERKRAGEVRQELDAAERVRGNPSNFDLDYNLGLLYFDVGAYDRSLAAAKRAYALGAPFPALEKKLRGAGKWQADDPAPRSPVEKVGDAAPKGPVESTGDKPD